MDLRRVGPMGKVLRLSSINIHVPTFFYTVSRAWNDVRAIFQTCFPT